MPQAQHPGQRAQPHEPEQEQRVGGSPARNASGCQRYTARRCQASHQPGSLHTKLPAAHPYSFEGLKTQTQISEVWI